MKKVLVIILVATLANFANAGLSFSGPPYISGSETIQIFLVADEGDMVDGYIWVDYPSYSGQLSNPLPAPGLESCIIIDTSFLPDAFSVTTNPGCIPLPGGALVTFDLTSAPGALIGDSYTLSFLDNSFIEVFSKTIQVQHHFDPIVTVFDPNGGETLQAGTTHAITWEGLWVPGDVKLEYSTNNGAVWSVITASTANDGQYNWTVPEVTSEQCLVRVSDEGNIGANDESDGLFTIYQCQLDSPADLNTDCKVTMPDLAAISAGWSDVYGIGDLAILADDWLRNGNPFDPGFTEDP